LDTFDAPSLADLLEPMQFKAMLLVTCGLENHQIAQCLRTTEHTIRNVLRNCYQRTGCGNIDELVRRYFCEEATGLLELGRLQRELAEIEGSHRFLIDFPNPRVSTSIDHIALSKGSTQLRKTDRDGVYRFLFIAPDRYLITIFGPTTEAEAAIPSRV
jgi:DNA-binding CsgD family transcriptional regulator